MTDAYREKFGLYSHRSSQITATLINMLHFRQLYDKSRHTW